MTATSCTAPHALMDRIESFASVVRATETYLKLRGQRASNLTTDGNLQAVSADIARHLQWGTADRSLPRVVATMDDPRFATTADRYFETTLLRYPQERASNLTTRMPSQRARS